MENIIQKDSIQIKSSLTNIFTDIVNIPKIYDSTSLTIIGLMIYCYSNLMASLISLYVGTQFLPNNFYIELNDDLKYLIIIFIMFYEYIRFTQNSIFTKNRYEEIIESHKYDNYIVRIFYYDEVLIHKLLSNYIFCFDKKQKIDIKLIDILIYFSSSLKRAIKIISCLLIGSIILDLYYYIIDKDFNFFLNLIPFLILAVVTNIVILRLANNLVKKIII